MTIFFMGTEIEDFPAILSAVVHQVAAAYHPATVRAGVQIPAAAEDSSYIETGAFSQSDFWTHFAMTAVSSTGTANCVKWYAGGTQRLALRWTAGTTLEVRKWTGSWATILTITDPIVTQGVALNMLFDVYIKLGNPGEMRVYMNNIPVLGSAALDLSSLGPIDKVRFGTHSVSFATVYSTVVVCDFNTLFLKYYTRPPTGNGNYQEWTNGGFAIVDDQDATGADLANSGTADQRTTYTHGATLPALGSGESVVAAKVTLSAARDVSGPQNINVMTRISSTDYHDSNQALNVGSTKLNKLYETSPASAVAWTVTELNATEFGVRSRA